MDALTRQLFTFDIRNLRVALRWYSARINENGDKGAYISKIDAEISADDRQALEILRDGELSIIAVTPEARDVLDREHDRLWTRFHEALEAAHSEILAGIRARQAAQSVVDAANGKKERPEVAPVKREKPEKGPHGDFWRHMMASGFCNIPAMRQHIDTNRTSVSVEDKDFLHAELSVSSLSFVSPDSLRMWIQVQFPANGASAILPIIEQAERAANKAAEKEAA